MNSGIYSIRHLTSGKVYVGSTINFKSRWANHRPQLRRGVHDNTYLQRAWAKYGEDAFEFAVLHQCPATDLVSMEEHHIKKLEACTRKYGYNLDAIVKERTVVSDETRAKLSAANKGKKRTEETRKRISLSKRGLKASDETRRILSISQTGRRHSEETLAKFRSHRHSEETKAKISASHIGIRPSDQTKEKIRRSNTGKRHTDEAKAKVSMAVKGRVVSDETKAKMSASIKRSLALRRERIRKMGGDEAD